MVVEVVLDTIDFLIGLVSLTGHEYHVSLLRTASPSPGTAPPSSGTTSLSEEPPHPPLVHRYITG